MRSKLMYGVGINDADHPLTITETSRVNGRLKRKTIWSCPFYHAWKRMLARCYCDKSQQKYPTYIGVTVCEEWQRFSNFESWMKTQDWEENQLDKDLLYSGNKVYSPETCVFVTKQINMFITESAGSRGVYKIGVTKASGSPKLQAQCNNPFTKAKDYLGLFDSEQEAHKAWLARKLRFAIELAEIQKDKRVAKALIDKYTNYQEIGDE